MHYPTTEWAGHVAGMPSNGSTPPNSQVRQSPLFFSILFSPLAIGRPSFFVTVLGGEGAMAAAAASVWLQLQVPPHRLHSPPVLSLPSNHSSSHACPPVYKYKKHAAPGRGNLLLCRASGASSSSVVTKEQEGAASDPSSEEGYSEPQIYSYKDDPNFRGCKGCGRDELERGCNGEGRIQGGIAAVPGFGWWPIKAYRPCPGFVASGGRYRRQGQSMDDVASGRGKKKPSPAKKKSDNK